MVLMHGTACLQDMGWVGRCMTGSRLSRCMARAERTSQVSYQQILRSMLSIAFGVSGPDCDT